MSSNIVFEVFLVLVAALLGGVLIRVLRLQPVIGYIIAGIVCGSVFTFGSGGVTRLADIGAILLLFSIGIELSLARLRRIFKVAVFGGLIEVLSTILIMLAVNTFLGFDFRIALILAFGFSLSSTTLVVKMLSDRGELDTIHGEVMVGWLLIQDLMVIPIMVLLPTLAATSGSLVLSFSLAIAKAIGVIVGVFALGRVIAPFVIHKIASLNSRELLVISAVAIALGTALLTSLFGISGALGAFLAGVVLSETQENHAIFAETRPLRDLFVALFFVALGFLVKFSVLISNFWLILLLVILLMIIKFFIFLFLSFSFGYHGKTAFQASMGLTQVGEFAFVIFSVSRGLDILPETEMSMGIMVVLISMILTPLIYKAAIPFWKRVNKYTSGMPALGKFVSGYNKGTRQIPELENHIIICGYGRVGSWIGKALDLVKVAYVVVDYNQTVVTEVKRKGINAIYGDPSEMEVLKMSGIKNAKAIVIAIPDRTTQEELITMVQTQYPSVKIYSRAHYDEDFERLKFLRVDKIVQPEFEAALAIAKSILVNQGKSNDDIKNMIKGLRLSKVLTKPE